MLNFENTSLHARPSGWLMSWFICLLIGGCTTQSPVADSKSPGKTVITKTESKTTTQPTESTETRSDRERMSVVVTPFYDANLDKPFPIVDVGTHSRILSEGTRGDVCALANDLKKPDLARRLSVELMYVLSIRLFDMGEKDKALFWYYAARFRSKLFYKMLQRQPSLAAFTPQFEVTSAHDAFLALVAPHVLEISSLDVDRVSKASHQAEVWSAHDVEFKTVYSGIKYRPKEQQARHRAAIKKEYERFARVMTNSKSYVALEQADGDKAVLKKLMADAFTNPLAIDHKGRNGLRAAFELDDRDGFVELLKAGVDPNENGPLGSVTHHAAHHDDSFWLRVTLQHGGDPNVEEHRGYTPLSYVMMKGLTENAKMLFKAGIDIDHLDGANTSYLRNAIGQGRYDIALLLLDRGCKVENGSRFYHLMAEIRYRSPEYSEQLTGLRAVKVRLVKLGYGDKLPQ
jgi:hypothetical protein